MRELNYKWIATKEQKWLDKWDEIQINSEQGVYTQISTWLKSYQSYGFDYELLLCIDDNQKIIAGNGIIIFKVFWFKLYISNWKPLFLNNSIQFIDFISFFFQRAKKLKCFASQINISNNDLQNINKPFYKGTLTNNVYIPSGFNCINFEHIITDNSIFEEQLLNSFHNYGRRDIRSSLRKNITLRQAKTEDEIKQAYQCFYKNSLRENYSIRSWQDQKEYLIESVNKNYSVVLTAFYEDNLKGAIWISKGGNMMTYMMGGVERTKPDLLIGYFLQWHAIKLSYNQGFEKYNLSIGGSKGVINFKNRFNPKFIKSENNYYFINRSFMFFLFQKIYPFFKKNKKLASQLLKLIKK